VRLWVDASYTLGSGRCSGIERVVNNLRWGLERAALGGGIPTATTMIHRGNFYRIGPNESEHLLRAAAVQTDLLGSLPRSYTTLATALTRLSGSPRLKRCILPERGHMGIFKAPYRLWLEQQRRRVCRKSERIQPGAGDLLVLPDAYWARRDAWQPVAEARQRGAMTVCVVYDLIPMTHPELVGPKRSAKFTGYLRQVARHADAILAISETVREQVAAALPQLMQGEPHCQYIRSFPLGAEFRAAEGHEARVRPEVRAAFTPDFGNNPYLTVAAFDPRKNHAYLLDAFDALWQHAPERTLCLAGRAGAGCQQLLTRIHNHPQYGKRLLVFHDLTDAELAHCYSHCRAVIYPSIVEGFGLPIIESLWHGRRTYASDTRIHREVGGADCLYFDLSNPGSLVQLLRDEPHSPPSVADTRDTASVHDNWAWTWERSVDEFRRQCLSAFAAHHRAGDATSRRRAA
jgi:glycosyltransferase involved in cell wall biosynthesis